MSGFIDVVGEDLFEGGRFVLAREEGGWSLDGVVADGRVYDVWADAQDERWMQFRPAGTGWRLDEAPAFSRVRLWVTLESGGGSVDVSAEPAAEPYVPLTAGEPPLPGGRGARSVTGERWRTERSSDVVVAAMLDAWTRSAGEAVRLGWMSGLPRGDDLLAAYVEDAAEIADHDLAFIRWLVVEWSRRLRDGLSCRRDAEQRRAAANHLLGAMAELARAIDPAVQLVGRAPSLLGAQHRHAWLVDEGLAQRLDNPSRGGPHRPILVVRPLVRRNGEVVLEGEVA